MAKKSSQPPPAGGPTGAAVNPIMDDVAERLAESGFGESLKVPSFADFGDVASRAVNKTAEGKSPDEVLTETLSETTQTPSIKAAKVITGPVAAEAEMKKVDAEVKEKISRGDFIGASLAIIGGGLGILSLFLGIGKFFGSSPTGSYFQREYTEGELEGRYNGRIMRGNVIDKDNVTLDIRSPTYQGSLTDEDTMLYLGDRSDVSDLNAIVLNSSREYKTPYGMKLGDEIVKDYMGDSLENKKPEYSWIKAMCSKDTIDFVDHYDGTRHKDGARVLKFIMEQR